MDGFFQHSAEYTEQLNQHRKDPHALVHPSPMDTEPEQGLHTSNLMTHFIQMEQVKWERFLKSSFHCSISEHPRDSSRAESIKKDIGAASVTDANELGGRAFINHGNCMHKIYTYFSEFHPECNRELVNTPPTQQRDVNTKTSNLPTTVAKERKWTTMLTSEEEDIYLSLLKCTYHQPLEHLSCPTSNPSLQRLTRVVPTRYKNC